MQDILIKIFSSQLAFITNAKFVKIETSYLIICGICFNSSFFEHNSIIFFCFDYFFDSFFILALPNLTILDLVV